jgi:ankyrin repeat protein
MFVELAESIKSSNLKEVKRLLKLHPTNDLGPYLKHACSYGKLNIIEFFILSGADVTYQNNYPIRIACFYGHLPVVKLLIQHGADISANNNASINHACVENHLKLAKFLIDNGANINDVESDCLAGACNNNNLNMVKLLLDNGVIITDKAYELAKQYSNIINYLDKFLLLNKLNEI